MSTWTDSELVQACLRSDQTAWAALIRRYQNLIYFFPRRYGANAEDAADVFQLVCAELFVALPNLRDHRSLRAWLMSVSSHQAYHWKRRHVKRVQRESDDAGGALERFVQSPSRELEEAESVLALHAAIEELPARDRELVRLLFFQDPPLPYQSVAQRLGLATGSIGLTRLRCLRKLERILEVRGYESAGVR